MVISFSFFLSFIIIIIIIIIIMYLYVRYGGELAGTAVADVIFGNYNPAGRLPITFYSSVNQIPAFENYDMTSFNLLIINYFY
jgi:hypothetical protein